jgi:hypothetical protein
MQAEEMAVAIRASAALAGDHDEDVASPPKNPNTNFPAPPPPRQD